MGANDRVRNGIPGAHLHEGVITRDQRRRRILLLSISALIVLSILPVFGHHMTNGAATLLADRHHLGVFCLIALHELLGPVHEAAHVILFLGLAVALFNRWRAASFAHRTIEPLHVSAHLPTGIFADAARAARVDLDCVRVVEGLPNPAFTVGWFRPRVYVSADLAHRLSTAELTAVFAHERVHVVRRDPFRLAFLRFFADLLFWLPALRRLARDAGEEAEIRADDIAAGEHPLALASAILKFADWQAQMPARVPGNAVGFAHHDIFERRVRRLAGEDPPHGTHVTWWSITSAASVLVLMWSAGVVVTHPMPDTRAGTDPCLHRQGTILTHLICPRHDRGFWCPN